jgi:diguanylate cyclase (GGDEF)-like protein
LTFNSWFSTWGILALGIALILGNSALFYRNLDALLGVEGDIRRTLQAEQLIDEVLVSLLDAETGQRGYLITNETKYLAPYYRALASIGGRLAALREVIGDNDEQRERVDALDPLVSQKLTELARSITIHTREGADASRTFVQTNDGIGRMDSIRSLLDALSAAEGRLLAERQRDYQVQMQVTIATMAILVFTCIVLFVTIVLLVRRQARQHAVDAERHARSASDLAGSLATLQRERNRIAEINEMASLLQSCHSLDELGQVARGTLGRLFGSASGGLYLHAPSRNQLLLLADLGGHGSADLLRPDECWSLRRGGVHHRRAGDDVPACGHFHGDATDADTLCLPLVAHGDTIGLLTFRHRADGAPTSDTDFDDDDSRRLADMTARHLALAVANLQLRDSLKEQSIRDGLTGAFNRRYLEVVGEKEIAQSLRFSRPFAVVMLDVDHFKRFNDIHGHAAGDLVLVTVCEHLRRNTREGDWLFRYGGEEFVLLLREMDGADAEAKAEALRRGIAELTVASGEIVLPPITVSMGIAVLTGNGERLGSVLERADEALYASKAAGRNRVTLHPRDRGAPSAGDAPPPVAPAF